jgi:hypothetical protein
MYLKNYTSNVQADVTIGRIERFLVSVGINGISKKYDNGVCVALVFELEFDRDKRVNIRLPANVSACCDALWADYQKTSPKGRKNREDFTVQASQTAWKLMQDWVEVQISLIALKQVDTLQVFLSYAWDGRQDFYTRMRESGFRALLPEKTGTGE